MGHKSFVRGGGGEGAGDEGEAEGKIINKFT